MSTRIYLVTDRDTQAQRLISAANQAQAIHHAVKGRFEAKVASQSELVQHIEAGHKVEPASAEASGA